MATTINISSGVTSSGFTIGNDTIANVYGTALYFDIQTSGLMNVYSGGSAKGTELEAGGTVMVRGGGTISDTLVYAGADINGFTIGSNYYMSAFSVMDASVGNTASAWLFNGQTASSVEVNSGGVLTVSSGASITTLQVSAGAELKILGGAVAKDVSMEAGTVLNGFTLQVLTNDVANVSSAVVDNTSGAVYSGRKVTSATISQGGNVSVFGGGVLSSAVNSGVIFVSNGGFFKDAVNSGTVNIFGGTGVQIANHTLLSVSSGGLVSGMTQFAGGSMNVDNSGFVSSAVISGGSVVVSAGGSMDQVQMTAGSMYVSGGAVEDFDMTNAYVSVGNYYFSRGNDGRDWIIGAVSGLVSSATVGSGGFMEVKQGTLNDVTVMDQGRLFMAVDNTVNNLVISSGAVVSVGNYISAAYKANNFSNTSVFYGGVLNGFTAVDSNIMTSGVVHRNVEVSSADQPAELFNDEKVELGTVKSGGTIHLSSSTVASISDLTVESGGFIHVDEDSVLVLDGKTTLNNGGGIVISRHIIHYTDFYSNAVDVFRGNVGTSCYSPVAGSHTAVISGTSYSRASAGAEWGTGTKISAHSVDPFVRFVDYTDNWDGGNFSSHVEFIPLNGSSSDGLSRITGGGVVSSVVWVNAGGSQARIRFDFTSATLAPNEAMLNDISRVSIKDTGVDSSTLVPNQYHDDPRYEFVYTSDLKDAYYLADGAEGFGVYHYSVKYSHVYNDTFRLVDTDGNALFPQQLNVDGNIISWNDSGIEVSARLQKEESHLSLELYRDDASSSAEITVAPYSTEYTNADVVLAAQFSQNTQFDTKIYNVDFTDGSSRLDFYKIYEGVVLDKNGTVTFGCVGADGNPVTKTVTVDWIDKLAPVITTEQSMLSGETIYSVTVTASAADVISPYYALSGLDEERGIQYSFTGYDDDWQPYSGSGVVVEHNGNVYFRAWDNAGNMGTQVVTVTNIVKDPKTPEIFSVSPTTLTNGTVSITVKFDPEAQENQVSENGIDYVQLTTERFGTYAAEKNGTYYFRSKYAVPGVYSSAQTYTVTNIDRTKPLAPVVTIEPEDVVLSAVLTAEYHELDSAKEYSLDYNPDSGIGNWQKYSGPITVTANLTYYFRETDLAGNESDVTPFKVTSIAVANAPAATVDNTELTKDPVHITVSPVTGTTLPMTYQYKFIEKDGSESDWIVFSPSATEITVDKNKTVKIRAVETADPEYSSLVTTVEVSNIDSLPPSIEKINYSRLDPNSAMTVSVISTDDIAGGVAKTEYTIDGGVSWTVFESVDVGDNQFKGSFELSAESLPLGFQVMVTDKVGNVTFSPEYVINNLVIIPSSMFWTKDDVTLTVKASDQLFGVKGLEYSLDSGAEWIPIELTEEGGIYTGSLTLEQNESILFRVTDNDDNVFTFVPYVYSLIDKVDPTIDSITGYDVWSNTNVTVSVTASDFEDAENKASGVAKTYYSFDGSPWTEFEGSFELSENGPFQLKVVDNAGNETTSQHYNIKTIDRLAPVIDAVDYSDAWTNGNVTVSVTAHDQPEDEANKSSGIGKMYYTFNGSAWTAFTDSFTLTENGSFQVKVLDNAGNETTSGSYSVTNIDKVAPVIDSVSWNTAWTNEPVTVSVSASDAASGVKTTEYSFDGGAWTVFTDTFTINENGSFQVRVTDNAGNEKMSDTYNVTKIDKVVPVINSVSWNTAWTNEPVTVSVSASDAASGVKTTEYSFNGGVNWTAFTDTFDVIENGTFQVKVTDNAGNVTTSGDCEVTNIDKVVPVIDSVSWNEGWTNEDVTVTVSASDALSGVATTEYSFDGGVNWTAFTDTFDVIENGTFQVKVTDNAGNVTTSGDYEVTNIDKVVPVIDSLDWNPEWTNADVTVTVSGSDALSGVEKIEYQLNGSDWAEISYATSEKTAGSFTLTEYGSFQVRVMDKAGNYAMQGGDVKIDKVDPVIDSVSWNTAWTNVPVTVSVSASDAASGVKTTEYSFDGGTNWTAFTDTFTVNENGTFNVRVTDNAGNVKVSDAYSVTNIDKIAPLMTMTTDTSKQNPVIVTVTATDNLSGVAKVEYSINGSSWAVLPTTGGSINVTENGVLNVRALDNAGNINSVSKYFSDVPSVVRKDGSKTFKVAVPGTYSITGDFGNITGSISVTNNDTTINGTIKQGVLTIGTGNQIQLSPAEATVQVTVTNGSLYPYDIFFYSNAVPTPAVSNDLNADGRADVLMSIAQSGHPAYGSTGAWLIQENQTPLWSDLSQYGSGWEIFGFGTVAAGKATDDVYLRSTGGNVVGAWVTGIDGKVSFWQPIGEFDSATQIVGLGDFNADGKTDLLLRNTNGAVGCYFTNGQGWNYFQSLGSEWKLSAVGDLNGDGLDDVVLKHDNGCVGTWLTQADGTVAWADLDTLPAGFEIVGAGDFNGDGTDDVLLQNGTYFGAWLVNNGNAVGWMGLGDLGSVAVEQIADFNGDGKDDLRIRTAGDDIGVQLVLGTDTLDWKYYGSVGSEWSTSLAALS